MPVSFISCASLAPPQWLPIQECPFTDALAVFSVYLPGQETCLPRLYALLQPDEQARANRFRYTDDRHRYIAGRGFLRLLAGRYTNQSPAQVTIRPGLHQKPILSNATGWHVNLSHAGDWVLLAVGRIAVGIDVEEIKPGFEFESLLLTTFNPVEQQQIQNAHEPLRLFYHGWTRKEALLKATGQGLNDNLPGVPCLTGEHQVPDTAIGSAGAWVVRDFAVSDTYHAAVANKNDACEPRFYTIETEFLLRTQAAS